MKNIKKLRAGFVYKSLQNAKYCLLSLLLLIPISSYADELWEWSPHYYGEFRAGYGTSHHIDGANLYIGRTLLGTIQGVKLNEYAQIGIGVDGVMYTHYYKGGDLRWALDSYVDLRGFYPINKKFKVFLDLGLGAYTNFKVKGDATNFFCQFGPGLQYRKLTLNTGLQHLAKKQNTFYATIGITF